MGSCTGTTSMAAIWPTAAEPRRGRTTRRTARGCRMPTTLCGRSIRGVYGRTWRVRRRRRYVRSCSSRVSASAIARFRATRRRRKIAGYSAAWTVAPPRGNRRTTVIPAWARRAVRRRSEPLPRSVPLRHRGLRAAEVSAAVAHVPAVAAEGRLVVVVEGEDANGSPNLDGGRCADGGDRTDPRRRANRPENFRNATGGGPGTG